MIYQCHLMWVDNEILLSPIKRARLVRRDSIKASETEKRSLQSPSRLACHSENSCLWPHYFYQLGISPDAADQFDDHMCSLLEL